MGRGSVAEEDPLPREGLTEGQEARGRWKGREPGYLPETMASASEGASGLLVARKAVRLEQSKRRAD